MFHSKAIALLFMFSLFINHYSQLDRHHRCLGSDYRRDCLHLGSIVKSSMGSHCASHVELDWRLHT